MRYYRFLDLDNRENVDDGDGIHESVRINSIINYIYILCGSNQLLDPKQP